MTQKRRAQDRNLSQRPAAVVATSALWYTPAMLFVDALARKFLGTFDYSSGTGGATVSLTGGKRLMQISCKAVGSDGTVTVAGGDSITVRAGDTFTADYYGALVNPAIVFSASMDYYVSYLSGRSE